MKTAVVTGASRGIGAATVRRLCESGCQVFMLDILEHELMETAQKYKKLDYPVYPQVIDVSSENQIDDFFTLLGNKGVTVDYLVNIAGVNVFSTVEEMSLEDWNRLFSINVTGPMLMLKHAVPLMKKKGGSVVNMGSVSADIGSDIGSAYCMSKGAVMSFTKSTAQEMAPYGIRVNAVAPGWVDTSFTDEGVNRADNPQELRSYANSLHLTGRIGKPEEIAEAIEFLLSERASFITGHILYVDGGFTVKR